MTASLIKNKATRIVLALLLLLGVNIVVGKLRGDDTPLAQKADASGTPADVQAPLSGTVSSPPGTHHRVYPEPRAGGVPGDVSLDVAAGGGTPVRPRVGSSGAVQLTVNGVFPACRSANGRLSR